MLRGGSTAGQGAYNGFDSWWATMGADAPETPAGRIVTVHEALHASLNDCTAYGIALAATGVLSRSTGRTDPLERLVRMCRTVHEAYATFGSVWLVSEGDLGLLAGRPDYLSWYRDAADLVPLPPGSRRTQLAVDEVARVCMQAPVLEALLQAGLDGPRPAVARADQPDVRFGWVHELARADFWASTWEHCAEVPGWDDLVDADADADSRDLTYTDELAPVCSAVAEVVYARLADLLTRRDAATLGYDDHRLSTAAVIAEVERIAPEARGALLASGDDASTRLEAFEVWSRERLVVCDRPRPARLHRIEEQPEVGLLSEHGGRTHVFCLARPASRLRTQFAFDAVDDQTLRNRGRDVVVAVVSAGPDVVDLLVLSRPSHLRAIVDARPGELSVLVNVTLSGLGDIAWRDEWAPALGTTRVTALVDLVPLRQFDLWRDDGSTLRYALGTISGGTAGAAVFVGELDDGGLRLLLPCTSVTADVLAEYLTSYYPAAEQTAAVFDGVQELVQITLSHLMSLEHAFDVAAGTDPQGGDR